MESSRVLIEKVHRCPFCHESVAIECDWLACRQCLARHHAACWREASCCAACRTTEALHGAAPLTGERILEHARRETAHSMLEALRRDERSARLVLGVVTFGVHPFVDAALSFAAHASDRDDRGDVLARVENARSRATDASVATRVLLVLLPLILIGPLLGAWALFAADFASAWVARPSVPLDAPSLVPACGLQLLLCFPAVVFLHVFREAVRRHELHQAFARVVADAVPRVVVADYLRFTGWRWAFRRLGDLVVTAVALVPLAGMLAFLLAGIRARGALALHEDDEVLLPRRSAPAPAKC